MARDIGNNNRAESEKYTQWPVELIEMVIVPGNPNATIRYTNLFHEITFDGNTYSPVGALLGISSIRDDLEAKDDDLTITLSGVTQGIIGLILNYEIPGSPVKIYRGFYDEDTGDLVEDPYKVWDGLASSWKVEDDNEFTNEDAVVVTLECRSTIEAILGRRNGVYTSIPSIQRYYSPTAESNSRSKLSMIFSGSDTTPEGESTILGFGNNILFPGDSSITGLKFANSGEGTVSTVEKDGANIVIRTGDDEADDADKLSDWESTINESTSLGFTAAQTSTTGELVLTPNDFDVSFDSSSVTLGTPNNFTIGTLTDISDTATNQYLEGCFDFVAGLIEKDFQFGKPD